MIFIVMGSMSALSLGGADFLGSEISRRIGAPRTLAGMLFVSSLVLSPYLLLSGTGPSLFNPDYVLNIMFAIAHGIALAFALVLFFYAMTMRL